VLLLAAIFVETGIYLFSIWLGKLTVRVPSLPGCAKEKKLNKNNNKIKKNFFIINVLKKHYLTLRVLLIFET
jgi:hypothetical protein